MRDFFFQNAGRYLPGAEYSRSLGTWVFPYRGRTLHIIAGSPFQPMDPLNPRETLEVLDIVAELRGISRGEMWELLNLDAEGLRPVHRPFTRRIFSGGWRG